MSPRGAPASLSPAERQRAEKIEQLAGDSARAAADMPALLDALGDPSWAVRRIVVATLIDLGDAAIEPLCELLRSRRDSEARIAAAVDVLAATGGAADEAVLSLAAHPDPAIVADAAQILGRRRSAAAVPKLAELTTSADDNVAVAAIEALGRVGGPAVVDPLVASVRSDNFFRTFPAIDVLGRSGDPRAVPPLAALLGNAGYAHEAARALGHTGDKGAVAPLARLLTHPSDALMRVAVSALAELYERHAARHGGTAALDQAIREPTGPGVVRRLIHAIPVSDPTDKVAICRVLGALGSEGAAPSLIRLLDEPGPVAKAAAEALKKLGGDVEVELVSAIQRDDSARRRALLPLFGARASVAPDLFCCLSDPDAEVRSLACDALARLGNPVAVPQLFELLSDPDLRIVQSASAAIQSLGSAQTEKLTLEAARSPDAQVRRAAFRIIAYFGYPSALDLLLEAIQGSDERLRESAVSGLPFIEDPRALSALLAAARHPDARTRGVAMRALSRCPSDPSVTSILREGLSDADAWVRYYACQSLGKLAFEPAAKELTQLLRDSAGQVRVAAVEALSLLRGDEAFEALRGVAASEDADMQRAALVGLGLGRRREALPILLDATSAPEPTTRLVAVSALAGFNDPEVFSALGRAAADKDSGVRVAALGLLSASHDPEATSTLIDLLRAPEPDDRILAALSAASEARIRGVLAGLTTSGDELSPRLTSALTRMRSPEAAAALVEALSLPNVPARKAAAIALGTLGTREAIEKLGRAAAEDADPEVRRICALALAH